MLASSLSRLHARFPAWLGRPAGVRCCVVNCARVTPEQIRPREGGPRATPRPCVPACRARSPRRGPRLPVAGGARGAQGPLLLPSMSPGQPQRAPGWPGPGRVREVSVATKASWAGEPRERSLQLLWQLPCPPPGRVCPKRARERRTLSAPPARGHSRLKGGRPHPGPGVSERVKLEMHLAGRPPRFPTSGPFGWALCSSRWPDPN